MSYPRDSEHNAPSSSASVCDRIMLMGGSLPEWNDVLAYRAINHVVPRSNVLRNRVHADPFLTSKAFRFCYSSSRLSAESVFGSSHRLCTARQGHLMTWPSPSAIECARDSQRNKHKEATAYSLRLIRGRPTIPSPPPGAIGGTVLRAYAHRRPPITTQVKAGSPAAERSLRARAMPYTSVSGSTAR
jgi:hypothetical protein